MHSTGDKDIPPPGSYYLKSDFDDKKKGPSIGMSREEVKFNSLIESGLTKNPGPGTYNMRTTIADRSFTMKGKIADYDLLKAS